MMGAGACGRHRREVFVVVRHFDTEARTLETEIERGVLACRTTLLTNSVTSNRVVSSTAAKPQSSKTRLAICLAAAALSGTGGKVA
jgi:hypothetical protein